MTMHRARNATEFLRPRMSWQADTEHVTHAIYLATMSKNALDLLVSCLETCGVSPSTTVWCRTPRSQSGDAQSHDG
jgi:hypothetical protein